jgi:hypothetical protein
MAANLGAQGLGVAHGLDEVAGAQASATNSTAPSRVSSRSA